MLKIAHRINTIKGLKDVPVEYGVEVDIRTFDNKLIVVHEPFQKGELLDDYLKKFKESKHKFIILEIKEEGIEKQVIALCKKHSVDNYFLLSVSFPFIYLLSKEGISKLALRYSEYEDINTCLSLKDRVEWVWVDTFTKNPLDAINYKTLKDAGFKLCLVCPSRWGREADLSKYKQYFEKEGITIDAIMSETSLLKKWS